MVIDEAFELADKGEIELKSGNDIQDVENGKGKGYDGDNISNKSTSWYNDDKVKVVYGEDNRKQEPY